MRRPRTHALVAAGELPECIAADEGVGFVYRSTEFVEIVSSSPKARGWKIENGPNGVKETKLPTRYLGA